MSSPAIISFGEVLWDLFPDGERFGGAPANFACHAAILGGDVTMVSAVGNDAQGREAVEILNGHGLRTHLVQIVDDAPTGTVGIELDAQGKPTFTIHQDSAWDRMTWNAELEARIARAGAVYFGTLGQRSELSRTTIRRALTATAAAGIPRVLDVNLRSPFYDDALIRDSIEHASILKLSDDEFAEVIAACGITESGQAEEMLRRLLHEQSLDLVVMTRGAEGALLVSADTTIDQPGFPTTVHDTVGAGDAFTAALVHGLLCGDPHDLILRTACERAAEVCSFPGAVPEPLSQ